VGTKVGLVYRLSPGICIGMNIGIANLIGLALIHVVLVQYQHTPQTYFAKKNHKLDQPNFRV